MRDNAHYKQRINNYCNIFEKDRLWYHALSIAIPRFVIFAKYIFNRFFTLKIVIERLTLKICYTFRKL